ncbi:MAG: tRNA(Ile)(2)-agmatinylcytidine synthase [Candidatus Bathyarchaeota archaeon]|nr:tRNA(Ile)(2)-agmatinylcytidine synthase [Candidatus Bathyarchaeota archaeon]
MFSLTIFLAPKLNIYVLGKKLAQSGKRQMHIGFDDTDSTKQGCTTYVAALLIEELEKLGVTFLDYPSLVRLNPNVPWKTRGNGALCLRIEYPQELEAKIKETTEDLVEAHSDIDWKGTDPGIVFLCSNEIPQEITAFAKKAETTVVTLKEALKLICKFHAEAFGYNTQRGIIGALAAIGETFNEDYTFEAIAYRTPENLGTKRRVNEESIFQMDHALKPYTFNNVDSETGRVVITPRGPDPILFGIRGETPETVKKALALVKPLEPVERWVIFRSNQGTDMHLSHIKTLSEAQPYSSIVAKATVSRQPEIVPVRHVIFAVKDQTAEVDCAAFEPTGELRKIARQLVVGDEIQVYGAARKPHADKPLTVNLEKINVLKLAEQTQKQNPVCPNCGRRLKSMGKNQGFRCEKCKTKFKDLQKTAVAQERSLKTGLYVTSTRSQRHLTKPLRRYGLEKHGKPTEKLVAEWHSDASV